MSDGLGAIVVLRDGKRVSWKVSRGGPPNPDWLSDKYFGGPGLRARCTTQTARFPVSAWDEAAAWCRTFERHPDAPPGLEP